MCATAADSLTLVIATRNRADELASTVRRLSTRQPGVPIVVVDNGSDDHTADTVRELTETVRSPLRLVRLTDNAGAAARNVAAAVATTPYLAFCDDDSWWAVGALDYAVDVLDRHPEVALLAGTIATPDGRADPVADLMANSPLGRPEGAPGPAVLGFVACGAVVRRDAFRAVGGFHPLLHIYGEETLLAYDLAAAGWQVCYVPELIAYHRPSTRRGAPARRKRRELRNAVLVALLRRPWRRAAAAVGTLIGRCARDPSAFVVVGAVLRRLPAAVRDRRVLPAHVERGAQLLDRAHGPQWAFA
jgi:GT2 family glycosyltransferase